MRLGRQQRGYGTRSSRGFTLVEILVVMLIIMLVSAAALPVVLPALRQRQVSEAGRIFQAALAGARDSAIANNAPRGIRLLPDPVLTQPPVGTYTTDGSGNQTYVGGNTTWACNRFIPIEPASDYRAGQATFFNPAWNTGATPAWYLDSAYSSYVNSYGANGYSGVLMLLQSFTNSSLSPTELTSWAWNLRVGDRIQLEATGNAGQNVGVGNVYTVVGPVVQSNPEGFVNFGSSGPPTPTGYTGPAPPEFLLLVNGVDDDRDGFVDNGFNGVSTPLNPYETEQWLGAQIQQAANPSNSILGYVAKRRPIPARGARETLLPSNVVIDLTTWNRSAILGVTGLPSERSRLPVDGLSRYIDVMLDPSGQVIQTTSYSSPTSVVSPFLHFWLTDREGVISPSTSLTSSGTILLPMPAGSPGYAPTDAQYLQGERMLITIFTRTGNITTTSLQNFDGATPDVSAPFYAAQRGVKETP